MEWRNGGMVVVEWWNGEVSKAEGLKWLVFEGGSRVVGLKVVFIKKDSFWRKKRSCKIWVVLAVEEEYE